MPDGAVEQSQEKLSVQEAFNRGFNDLNFFARMCIPDVMTYNFPDHYIAIWLMLVNAMTAEDRAKVLRYALGLPRGFAKTTFIKILICWLIVYDRVSFILIVCATEPLAEFVLGDIHEILSSSTIETVYGVWSANCAIDKQDLKKSIYRGRVVIIKAMGSNSSVRGVNIDNDRPDLILCDDMQTKENSESETESFNLLTWFTGTLIKCVTPRRPSTIIYLGNMYAQNCILQKLQDNKYWTSLITGCILSDGTSLWEELHPVRSLHESYKHDEALGLGYIWFAEMMNQPILEHVSLLPQGTIPPCPKTLSELYPSHGFIVIDPAGFRRASDDNVIKAFIVDDQVPYCVKLHAGNFDPLTVIQKTVETAFEFNIRIIFIESVAYQMTLKFWFQKELERAGLQDHFVLVDISPRNKAKEGRIRVSVQQLLSKTWYLLDQEARQRYTFQALSYKIGKPKQKDDILDAGAYLEEIRTPENWTIVQSFPLIRLIQQEGKLLGEKLPF